MPDHQKTPTNVICTTIVVFGSNTLGPASLKAHGFDWLPAPIEAAALAPLLDEFRRVEDCWGIKIRQWQKEGAMGDEEFVIAPGVIGWLVAIEGYQLDHHMRMSTLGNVSEMLALHRPHVTVEFCNEHFDAHGMASDLARKLRHVEPIPYRYDGIVFVPIKRKNM